MTITYKVGLIPAPQQIIHLYNNAGLPRPTTDADRIEKMYANSNLVVTAWDETVLVGAARCITDWVWSCYLADLAVRSDYKKAGIGKELIDRTKKELGDLSMLLLLSVPAAMDYYPKVGFTKPDNAFIINRVR